MTTDFPVLPTALPARFERAATLHADRTAVTCRLGEITYRDLNARANRVAAALVEHGAVHDRVAILMPQDRRMVTAMIGALKAGRIVLVLNVADPPARLSRLIADAEPSVILTVRDQRPLAESLTTAGVAVVDLDEATSTGPSTDRGIDVGPDATAFLVYTSGSTGEPKGVMQTHGHVQRDTDSIGQASNISSQDRVLLVASLWGAQAVSTAWMTLLSGATLMSFPAAEDGLTGLGDWLVRQCVTVFASAASLFRHFEQTIPPTAAFPGIRLVRLSADKATPEDLAAFNRHFPKAVLMNAIGCSETTYYACAMYPSGTVLGPSGLTVGRSLPAAEFRIVDRDGRELPSGTVGTIQIRSRYIAAGYWRDAEMTGRHFFAASDGTRLYRGGDLGFVNPDGDLVFMGRSDTTVKIRGQRVDLAEVENAVSALPGVAQTAAVAAKRHDGERHLVAYVVPEQGCRVSARRLRTAARALMARHLIPSLFVILDAIPLSANGKPDRNALRDRAPASLPGEAVPPTTETEALLVRLWSEAFELTNLGSADEFFELGGDSLIATVIAARLHAATGISLDFGAFVDHPALGDLAAFVDAQRHGVPATGEPAVAAMRREETCLVSPLQEQYWRQSRPPAYAARFTRTAAGWIDGPVDVEALRGAVWDVLTRHEILRTRFEPSGNALAQRIEPADAIPLPVVDLSEADDPDASAMDYTEGQAKKPFDLGAGPPIALALLKLAPARHVLVESCHHIVMDGPSWVIFVNDLARAYDARRAARPPSWEPLAVQFADYGAWERRAWHPESVIMRRAVEWWKGELAGSPPPADFDWLKGSLRRRPAAKPDPGDWSIPMGVDPATSERLDALAASLRATYFSVRLAAMLPAAARSMDRDRIGAGIVFSNRVTEQLQPLFGPFAGVLEVPVTIDWNATFIDLVTHVRQQLIEVRNNAWVPHRLLASALQASGGPQLPPAPFMLHLASPVPPVRLGEARMTWKESSWYPMPPGLVARLDPLQEQDRSVFRFDARVYAPDRMREFVGRITAFVRTAARDPSATLARLIETSGVDDRPPAAGSGLRLHDQSDTEEDSIALSATDRPRRPQRA